MNGTLLKAMVNSLWYGLPVSNTVQNTSFLFVALSHACWLYVHNRYSCANIVDIRWWSESYCNHQLCPCMSRLLMDCIHKSQRQSLTMSLPPPQWAQLFHVTSFGCLSSIIVLAANVHTQKNLHSLSIPMGQRARDLKVTCWRVRQWSHTKSLWLSAEPREKQR